jgi:hypothetical protein
MENIINKITDLTNQWYFLIGKDHHKDRDCHWYIETKWSYGEPPKYFVRHFGYILDEIEKEYSSFESALKGLEKILEIEIEKEKKFQLEDSF